MCSHIRTGWYGILMCINYTLRQLPETFRTLLETFWEPLWDSRNALGKHSVTARSLLGTSPMPSSDKSRSAVSKMFSRSVCDRGLYIPPNWPGGQGLITGFAARFIRRCARPPLRPEVFFDISVIGAAFLLINTSQHHTDIHLGRRYSDLNFLNI